MSNTIKGFRGADGPILLDFSGVGNVPGAVKSIAELTAQVGDIFEVESVDAESKVATVKAVAKPAGDGGTVPTKVSAFENDAGYQTEAQVNALMAAFPTFEIQVVAQLPAEGAEKTIYLVPFADDSGSYLEYLYVNGAWEVIGSGKDSGENQTYVLPVANANTLGGVKAQAKTAAMTQPVGVDANGNLYTLPPAQSTSEVGGVEFTNHVGNLFSAENLTKEVFVGNDVLSMGGTGIHSVFFRAKPSTSYVLTRSKMSNMGVFGVANAQGICIQKPGIGDSPVVLTKWYGGSGGLGGYIIVTTNEHYPAEGAYLIWAIPDGGLTGGEAVIYEGDSIDGYDTVNAYSPLNGVSTSDNLQISATNLDTDLAKCAEFSRTAIQPCDLKSKAYAWNAVYSGQPHSFPRLSDFCIADAQRLFDSARIVMADANHLALGKYYAHCPTVTVIGDKAYVLAFQNTNAPVDYFEQCTIEMYIVDLENWAVLEQINVASPGMACGEDTLKIGGGDPNVLNIDDATLRIIFTTQLSDGVYCMCYRDYDVTAGMFGDIGLCKISNGTDTYDLNIAGVKAVCGDFGATNPVINMATQYATYNGEHYIGIGVDSQYSNIPILKTTDFITFNYWATPTVEGNAAHYEMALIAVTPPGASVPNLMTATRQVRNDQEREMLIMCVSLTSKAATGSFRIPDAHARPFWQYVNGALYLWHINDFHRKTSCIDNIPVAVAAMPREHVGRIADMFAMLYPSAVEYNGELVVAYMRSNALFISRIPKVPIYKHERVVPILNKMLDYFTAE